MPEESPPIDPSPDEDSAFLRRVMSYLDDTLPREAVAELERDLASSARKREAFALICYSDTLALEKLAANPVPELRGAQRSPHGARARPGRSRGSHPPGDGRKPRWRVWGGVAAVVLITVAAALVFLNRRGARPTAATLVEEGAAKWEGSEGRPSLGMALASGRRLALESGRIGLQFGDGTLVVVGGPARLVVDSPGSLTLDAGRILAKMPAGTSGFTVNTPSATVADLGTEMGVIAGTGATDVHVFTGRARVGSQGPAAPSRVVAAGEFARVDRGAVDVGPGVTDPETFAREFGTSVVSLDVADLASGGDGTSRRRGGVIDPETGAVGTIGDMPHGLWLKTDGRYHRVASRPIADGCFMPDGSKGPTQVDSAGHRFQFPATSGRNTYRICVGGTIFHQASAAPPPKEITPILTVLGGVDYSRPEHGYLLLHPNCGLTFDLAAIRRLRPEARLARFRCKVGNSNLTTPPTGGETNFFLLVDGRLGFQRRFWPKDGVVDVPVALTDSDRFLTVATTEGGDGLWDDCVLLADPAFDLIGP